MQEGLPPKTPPEPKIISFDNLVYIALSTLVLNPSPILKKFLFELYIFSC